MKHTISRNRGAAVGLAAVTVVALAGCGSSAGGSTDTGAAAAAAAAGATTQPQATQPARPSAEPSAAAPATSSDNVVTIDAIDSGSSMTYKVSGSPSAGLATIIFNNKGSLAHEMGLSRLKDGVTLDQMKALVMSQAPDAEQKAQALQVDPDTETGGPSILGPGLSEQVELPLAAGHYVVTCFLPDQNGMPHVAMGMIGEFTVEGSGPAAAAPTSDGTVTLTDDGITVPSGFSGDGTFQIENKGTKPHDFSIAKLADQPLPTYFQCVAGSFGKGRPIDTCPGTLSGGVMTVQPGTSVYLTLPALPAGQYGYVSTAGDGADFQAGLNGTFTVN